MHRTNLYLSEDQERELDARARLAGVTRSALVRQILDAALTPAEPPRSEMERTYGRMSAAYHDVVAQMFEEDPDLRVER